VSRRGELIRPSRVQLCWRAAIQLDVNRAAKTTQAGEAERPDGKRLHRWLAGSVGELAARRCNNDDVTDECAVLEHTVPVISASLA